MLNDRHFQIRFRTLKLHYDSLINSSLNQKSVQWSKEVPALEKSIIFCIVVEFQTEFRQEIEVMDLSGLKSFSWHDLINLN